MVLTLAWLGWVPTCHTQHKIAVTAAMLSLVVMGSLRLTPTVFHSAPDMCELTLRMVVLLRESSKRI
eukprot:3275901-Amphidinium_carterae.1